MTRQSFAGIQNKKVMNKDQVKGRVEEAKGKVKEVAGSIIGDKTLESKGKVQKNVGRAQASDGDAKKTLKGGA